MKTKSTHGGSGRNQGRHKSTEPTRIIRKQIRWTEDEWPLVEAGANSNDMSEADFQRKCILDKCRQP